jgi:excisionase family DNA binding protein
MPRPKKSPEPAPETRFLSVEKTAKACDVSKHTVYRMIASGQLRAVKFGSMLRVDISSIGKVPTENPA